MVNSINALFNKVEEKEMRIKEEMKELDETINPIEKNCAKIGNFFVKSAKENYRLRGYDDGLVLINLKKYICTLNM